MITIRKVLADNFSVMTDHGTYSMGTVAQLVKIIEQELDIDIFDQAIEAKIKEYDDLLEEYGDTIGKLETRYQELHTGFLNLKKQVKDKS